MQKDMRLRENKQLTGKQEIFIEHYFLTGSKRKAGIAAGYSNPDVQAWKNLQDEKVLDALIEMIRKNQKAEALVAHKALLELVQEAPPAIRLKAATEILNRSGLMIVQQHEHKHTIEDNRTDQEIKAQIEALASEMGLKTKVINGEIISDSENQNIKELLEIEISSEESTRETPELPEWLR